MLMGDIRTTKFRLLQSSVFGSTNLLGRAQCSGQGFCSLNRDYFLLDLITSHNTSLTDLQEKVPRT